MNNLVRFLKYYIYLLPLSIFLGCSSQKELVKEKPINHKNADFLIEQLQANELTFDWFSAKASIAIDINDKSHSFIANMRIKKDSIIWMSISPALGIEAMRVVITKDSVKYINRLDKSYSLGNFQSINDLLQDDLTFEMIQSLIIGNSVSFDKEDKYKASVDRKNDLYLISTFKKRRLKKAIKKENPKRKVFDDIIYSIWLEPKNYKIKQFSINDFRERENIMVKYASYKPLEQQLFAHQVEFQIETEKKVFIKAEYSKVYTNKVLEFPFKIPEKYVQIY